MDLASNAVFFVCVSEQLLNRLGRTSAKALPLPKVCLHFTGVSLHSLPSCEISARSEIPYEMYNVRQAIKACSHLALSQRATVVLQNRSCRERREEKRRGKFVSSNAATRMDGDDYFPLINTEIKCNLLYQM